MILHYALKRANTEWPPSHHWYT